jgi:hypothetical protein
LTAAIAAFGFALKFVSLPLRASQLPSAQLSSSPLTWYTFDLYCGIRAHFSEFNNGKLPMTRMLTVNGYVYTACR